MKPIDVIVFLILALVIGGAIFYMIQQKKKGMRCIGCPNAKSCSGNCTQCRLSSKTEEKEE